MYNDCGCWVSVLEKLVISGDEQQGFKTLKQNDRLDISFEQLVINYSDLFSKEAVESARWRLDRLLS